MPARRRRLYADSSALVKLIVHEPETGELRRYLTSAPYELVTSALSKVEVFRAATLGDPAYDTAFRVDRLLRGCTILDITDHVLERAARLASERVRTLDAIHLASAEISEPDVMLAYDDRLAEAASAHGIEVSRPGRT